MSPMVAIPVFYMNQFAHPDIRAALQAMLAVADEGAKWQQAVMEISLAAMGKGIPNIWGALSQAPYDMIGDTMRGTRGIMLDMYKRPDKLREAMERLVPLAIREGVNGANRSGCPIVFMPLHKGTGGFMSNKQFATFYWPTLKAVMMGLIEEGLVPMLFAEGDYIPRLEIIQDMPPNSVIWYFEHMDMALAKKSLGSKVCIAGNLPVSVLCTGTPDQVMQGCRQLIETCAPGGGYILSGAASMNEGNPENLRAMMAAARQYGRY
jgi:uroporphyrinogen-III decarboxylase